MRLIRKKARLLTLNLSTAIHEVTAMTMAIMNIKMTTTISRKTPLCETLFCAVILLGWLMSFAELHAGELSCTHYTDVGAVAWLPAKSLPESSGLAISRALPDRWYHVNDSGGGPYFYFSDSSGGGLQKVEVADWKARDPEDLTMMPNCEGSNACLVIGDIGDNKLKRDHLSLIFILEKTDFGRAPVEAKLHLKLTYPDRPHNAESLAYGLDGNFYLLTKEIDQSAAVPRTTAPPPVHLAPSPQVHFLFKIDGSVVRKQLASGATDAKLELVKVAEIDTARILGGGVRSFSEAHSDDVESNPSAFDFLPTSIDFNPITGDLLLLTYSHAIIIDWVSLIYEPSQWRSQIVELPRLFQQESVAWAIDGQSFYFGSEAEKGAKLSPIRQMRCDQY